MSFVFLFIIFTPCTRFFFHFFIFCPLHSSLLPRSSSLFFLSLCLSLTYRKSTYHAHPYSTVLTPSTYRSPSFVFRRALLILPLPYYHTLIFPFLHCCVRAALFVLLVRLLDPRSSPSIFLPSYTSSFLGHHLPSFCVVLPILRCFHNFFSLLRFPFVFFLPSYCNSQQATSSLPSHSLAHITQHLQHNNITTASNTKDQLTSQHQMTQTIHIRAPTQKFMYATRQSRRMSATTRGAVLLQPSG